MDDSSVMDRVQAGHLEAMALLFERHHRKVFGFLLRLSGDRQTAEDLTQDVFLQMLRARQTWRAGSPFLPWMFQIARNLHLSHLRRLRPEVPSEALLEVAEDAGDKALQAVALQQDQDRLRRALGSLPLRKRELLLLSREEHLSYRDVAGLLSMSVASVKVGVHRALQDLRKAFLELEGGWS